MRSLRAVRPVAWNGKVVGEVEPATAPKAKVCSTS